MTASPDNLLTPGLFADPDPSNPEAAKIAGAQALVRGATNLLWRGARGVAGDVWENLIKPPGQILSGERTPYAGYVNSLDPAAYAGRLAEAGLGIRALGGPLQTGVVEHFPAWHGTGIDVPFEGFRNEFIGTGEGTNIPGLIAEHAWGHYISGMPQEAAGYKQAVGGYKGNQGAFLDIHVIPEQDELLDWDKNFSGQSDSVQEKLRNSMVGKAFEDPYSSARDRSGAAIYDSIVRRLEDSYSKIYEFPSRIDLKKEASKHLDDIGIPGMKFRAEGWDSGGDQALLYKGDNINTPGVFDYLRYDDPNMFYKSFVEPAKGNANVAIDKIMDHLESERDNIIRLKSEGENPYHHGYLFNYDPANYDHAIDWLDKNRHDFQIFSGVTPYNYVMFDGRHLNITHWDGKNMYKLFPVDHDPLAGENMDAWRLEQEPMIQPLYNPTIGLKGSIPMRGGYAQK